MREFFTIAIFKIKADIRMNKTTLNSQKEKHSTLSLRRATTGRQSPALGVPYFYPRSPCGERRMMKLFSQLSTDISIHALLAESDRCCPCAIIAPAISIHALLAESDLLPFAMTITALDFYPRSPCGERPKRYLPCCTSRIFLSTLSLRRATHPRARCALGRPIFLSTLSLRRATPPSRPTTSTPPNFYPRSPCGERLSARCAAPCAR